MTHFTAGLQAQTHKRQRNIRNRKNVKDGNKKRKSAIIFNPRTLKRDPETQIPS